MDGHAIKRETISWLLTPIRLISFDQVSSWTDKSLIIADTDYYLDY